MRRSPAPRWTAGLRRWLGDCRCRWSLQRLLRRLQCASTGMDADATVALLFSPAARCVRPWQDPRELLQLARLLERRRPRVVVEIGTARGGTLLLAARLAADDALLVSIDLPDGPRGGGYPSWKMSCYRRFVGPGQRIELIRGDSHDPGVQARLRALLAGRGIDYLFLDGDHSFAGVRRDFADYAALLAPGAMVALHDIAPDRSAHPDHFVAEYWAELRQRFPCHQTFIRDPGQDKLGLGVLWPDGAR